MKRTPIFVLALTLASILTGCVSIEDIRNQPPARAGEFKAEYQDLAACITRAWGARTNNNEQLVNDPAAKTAYITDSYTELRVQQVAPGRVRVEYRRPEPVVAIGNATEVFWADVEACGMRM